MQLLDLDSGEVTRAFHPRIPVTGRFDPAEIRALLLPSETSPPTPHERDGMLAAQRAAHVALTPADLQTHLGEAVPGVGLRACLPPNKLVGGGSRLGGRPDVPPGFTWPTRWGRPMAFLAQLQLRDIALCATDGALPEGGLVLVFIDLEPDGEYPNGSDAVLVVNVDDSELKPARWPAGLSADRRWETAVLVPEPLLTLPAEPAGLDVDDYERWEGLLQTLMPAAPHHRVLGHPASIQGIGPQGHTLLLQIESDSSTGMTFGDGGSLQIWGPRDAVRSGTYTEMTVGLDSF